MLAVGWNMLEQYKPDAVGMYEEALGLARAFHGPGDRVYALATGTTGTCYAYTGRPADAQPLLGESLALTRELLGHDDPLLSAVGLLNADQRPSKIWLATAADKEQRGPQHRREVVYAVQLETRGR